MFKNQPLHEDRSPLLHGGLNLTIAPHSTVFFILPMQWPQSMQRQQIETIYSLKVSEASIFQIHCDAFLNTDIGWYNDFLQTKKADLYLLPEGFKCKLTSCQMCLLRIEPASNNRCCTPVYQQSVSLMANSTLWSFVLSRHAEVYAMHTGPKANINKKFQVQVNINTEWSSVLLGARHMLASSGSYEHMK